MSLRKALNLLLNPLKYEVIKVIPADERIELDPSKGSDDYDWRLYHKDYSRQIAEMSGKFTQKLQAEDAHFVDGHLTLRNGLLPLHPNHTALYEAIAELAPNSTFEIGCGGGDHLHNLSVLIPDMKIRGFDRSPDQLKFLKQRSPLLKDKVSVMDATLPPSAEYPTAELVYSQAVIMHIQAGNGHLVALSNMFRMAEKYVVLMENWKRHHFLNDIQMLRDNKMINWKDIHFYIHRYNETPHLMILSKADLPIETLESYDQLTDAA